MNSNQEKEAESVSTKLNTLEKDLDKLNKLPAKQEVLQDWMQVQAGDISNLRTNDSAQQKLIEQD